MSKRPGKGAPCEYCHKPMNGVPKLSRVTMDHVHPRSAGGPTAAWNTAWCCERCNGDKGNKLIWTWLMWLRDVGDPRAPIVEAFIGDWEQRPGYRHLGTAQPTLPPKPPRRQAVARRALDRLPMPQIPRGMDVDFWLAHVSKPHCPFCSAVGHHRDGCVLQQKSPATVSSAGPEVSEDVSVVPAQFPEAAE
jgi:hypothetical protein